MSSPAFLAFLTFLAFLAFLTCSGMPIGACNPFVGPIRVSRYSMGGMFTNYLMAQFSSTFRAFVIVAGLNPRDFYEVLFLFMGQVGGGSRWGVH